MKPKNFGLAALLVVIIGVGIWWFMRPTTPNLVKAAQSTLPTKADAPTIVPHIAQVEPPKLPPAIPGSADAPPMSDDPQTDLKTAISNLVRLIRDGEWATFRETYDSPNFNRDSNVSLELRESQVGFETADPQEKKVMQQGFDVMALSYEALETQTPIFNAAGDEATYQYAPPMYSEDPVTKLSISVQGDTFWPITFIKINGRWYIKLENPSK